MHVSTCTEGKFTACTATFFYNCLNNLKKGEL